MTLYQDYMCRCPAVLCLCLFLAACVTPSQRHGPLAVRNQHPAQLTVLSLDPVGAQTLAPGQAQLRLDAAYTSLFLQQSNGGNVWGMDGEVLRTGLKTRIGLLPQLELQVELAGVHSGGGFLDDFVESWHDSFNLSNQGRELFPQDQFAVQADFQGKTAYQQNATGFEVMDLPIGLNYNLLPFSQDNPFALTLRGAIELPTGDQGRGFGNGGLDAAVGLVGEFREGPYAMQMHLQHSFVRTPQLARQAGLSYQDVSGVGLSMQASVSQCTTLLAQVELSTSVLRDIPLQGLEKEQLLLWLGLRQILAPKLAMELAFGEDLSTDAPPDFTAYLALVWNT